MKIIIPETKSCCFCISQRYGLLIWGLLKLLPALAYATVLINIVISFYMTNMPAEYLLERILMAISNFVDICFTGIFLYATYKKNLNLLKLYFYYSLTWMFMFLYCFIISSESEMVNVFATPITSDMIIISPLAIVIHTFTLFLQVYLIVQVNSMIEEIKRESEVSVENGEKHSTAPTQCIDDEKY